MGDDYDRDLQFLQAMNQNMLFQGQLEQWRQGQYTPAIQDGLNYGSGYTNALGGAMGSIGNAIQGNADRSMMLRQLDAQQQAAQIPYQIAAMQQQGQTDRLAMLSPIFQSLFGGGGGASSARPGNITSNIGSGVSWSGGAGSSPPQAYDYGRPAPGQYIPPAQGQQGGGQSQYVPPNYSSGGTGSSTTAGGSSAVNPTQQAGGQQPNAYRPPSPYGPADRYNRYRDEQPFVGDLNTTAARMFRPGAAQANADWRAGINGYRA